jgi:hypothetical protein
MPSRLQLPLHPLEHFHDIIQRKMYDRRPSVRAGVRHPALEEIMDQGLHLLLVKMPVHFDGRMTGHHAQDIVPKLIHLPAFAMDVHFIEDIEQQFPVINAYENGRHGLDHERPAAEVIDYEPEAVELGQILREQTALGRAEFHLVRHEQALNKNVPVAELVLEFLEQHPFVRCVLVDDRHSFP